MKYNEFLYFFKNQNLAMKEMFQITEKSPVDFSYIDSQNEPVVKDNWKWNLIDKLNTRFKEQQKLLQENSSNAEKLKSMLILKEVEIENLCRQLEGEKAKNSDLQKTCENLCIYLCQLDAQILAFKVKFSCFFLINANFSLFYAIVG